MLETKLSLMPWEVTPLNNLKTIIAKSKVVAEESVSPGFDMAMKLLAYQDLMAERKAVYPFGANNFFETELRAKDNRYLPTVGVELEIPVQTVASSQEPYDNLNNLLLDQCSGKNGSTFWEFVIPYSYAAKTQELFIRSLANMHYIPYLDYQQDIPLVPNPHKFSVHLNLGIPTAIDLKVSGSEFFLNDATRLAMACGLAFTPLERLADRKMSRCVSIDRESDASNKNPKREIGQYGRVEITPLGFGHPDSYYQLEVIQKLGAAFFAYEKDIMQKPVDDIEASLVRSWIPFSNYLNNIYNKTGLTPNIFNDSAYKNEFREKVTSNCLVDRLRELVLSMAERVDSIMAIR